MRFRPVSARTKQWIVWRSEIRRRGMEVFARIDHAAGAIKAGLELLPTEVIIFGQARGGTPLMRITQTIGIGLPVEGVHMGEYGGQTVALLLRA